MCIFHLVLACLRSSAVRHQWICGLPSSCLNNHQWQCDQVRGGQQTSRQIKCNATAALSHIAGLSMPSTSTPQPTVSQSLSSLIPSYHCACRASGGGGGATSAARTNRTGGGHQFVPTSYGKVDVSRVTSKWREGLAPPCATPGRRYAAVPGTSDSSQGGFVWPEPQEYAECEAQTMVQQHSGVSMSSGTQTEGMPAESTAESAPPPPQPQIRRPATSEAGIQAGLEFEGGVGDDGYGYGSAWGGAVRGERSATAPVFATTPSSEAARARSKSVPQHPTFARGPHGGSEAFEAYEEAYDEEQMVQAGSTTPSSLHVQGGAGMFVCVPACLLAYTVSQPTNDRFGCRQTGHPNLPCVPMQ